MAQSTDSENSSGFQASLEYASVFLPGDDCGGDLRQGTLAEMRQTLVSQKEAMRHWPVVIFMQGSGSHDYDRRIARWLVSRFNLILISPATHALTNRPQYTSPANTEVYRKVHEFRRSELAYIVHRVNAMIGVDSDRLLLMGHSEGAVAVGTWTGEASARVLLAWSCEENYFSRNHRIAGDHQATSILNIVGSNDEYFAARDSLSASDDVAGHGVKALSGFRNAKVVIYPGEGHRVLDNPNAPYDLAAFFERWYQNFRQVPLTQQKVNPN